MKKGLTDRLKDGEHVIVAEGYLLNFQRRGYIQAGAFVPEVVLEHPELVKHQYREFVQAGSDVVLAFTFYAHREKMRLIGREKDLEIINKTALRLAKEVADETESLLAGNICTTTLYDKDDPDSPSKVTAIFKEQIEWALEFDVDYIVGETFPTAGEAMLALEAIKKYGRGVPAVITLASHPYQVDGCTVTIDQVPLHECCRQLEEAGAAVVGLNCTRGTETMLPIIEQIRKACKGPIAALPVAYRTTAEEPTWLTLTDPHSGLKVYPDDLGCRGSSSSDFIKFGQRCKDIGVQYVGICCGNEAQFMRNLAESLGRRTQSSNHTTDMSKNYILGNHPSFKKCYTDIGKQL